MTAMPFVWMRRAWQAIFLGLFLFLVFVTTASLIGGYPVEWFLGFDPLVAVTTGLAQHSLHRHLLWAVPLIAVTVFFGRAFCGWMCPMGAMHHGIGFLARPKKIVDRVPRNRPSELYQVKYFILAVVIGGALVGSNQTGLLDPIAFTWRALSTSLVPALDGAMGGAYQGVRHFHFSTIIAALFLGALSLNFIAPRLYCRMLCPLGALLGVFSKLAIFRLVRDDTNCKDCNVCAADCQGAADPQGARRITECFLCLNCVSACPRDAFSFKILPSPDPSTDRLDLGRRKAAAAVLAGVALVPLARASDGVEPRPDPRRIRPPGALAEDDFLGRCLKCGACMKVCPTGGLQPALTQAGFEGLWSPVLVPRVGYCEQGCTLCGQVCPTGAIRHLGLAEKIGEKPFTEPIRLGSAFIDRGRCLPWAMDTPCIVCEEVCPTAPKAVYFKEETVVARDGSSRTLKRPFVDLDRCWGCGVCEARCPVFDQAAIRVTSVGETRSARNRIMLTGGKV